MATRSSSPSPPSSSSSAAADSTISLVLKLNKKITDAEYMDEDKLLKILNRLFQLDMTLEILQKTRVGITINPLKKVEGKVGEKAKAIIKKWKKLLPENNTKPTASTGKGSEKHLKTAVIKQESTLKKESSTNERYRTSKSTRESLSTGSSRHNEPANTAVNSSSHGSVFLQQMESSNNTATHSSRRNKSTKSGGSTGHQRPSSMTASAAATTRVNMGSFETSSGSISDVSRKRKGESSGEENESIAVAFTKKSRTQVYSGKAASLKFVPSLFDTCMNVLIDNIDAIEEVGGVPFFILEPVLSKCSPTQLMRLEEFNPHFIEDSDGLWEKHVQKEFKASKPSKGMTWRDLYMHKIEEREHKMKSITSIIRARQQAREEPVRKAAILNTAPLPPRRRGGFHSRSSFTNEEPRKSNLMKQTMKMAQNRHMMVTSRRPKR